MHTSSAHRLHCYLSFINITLFSLLLLLKRVSMPTAHKREATLYPPGLIYSIRFVSSTNFNISLMAEFFALSGSTNLVPKYLNIVLPDIRQLHVASPYSRLIKGVFPQFSLWRCLFGQYSFSRPTTTISTQFKKFLRPSSA